MLTWETTWLRVASATPNLSRVTKFGNPEESTKSSCEKVVKMIVQDLDTFGYTEWCFGATLSLPFLHDLGR